MAKKNEKGKKENEKQENTVNNVNLSFTKKIEKNFNDLLNFTKNIDKSTNIYNTFNYAPVFNLINETTFLSNEYNSEVVLSKDKGTPTNSSNNSKTDLNIPSGPGMQLFDKTQAFLDLPLVSKGVSFLGEKIQEVSAAAKNMNNIEGAIGKIIPDKQVASAFFDHVQKKSMDSINGVEKVAGAYQTFLGVTKNTKSLDDLVGFSEKLALFDTGGTGLEGSIAAVEKLAGGDFSGIADYLTISPDQIEHLNLDEIIQPGDVEGNLNRLQQRLAETGILTDQMVQERMGSSETAVGGSLEKIKTKFTVAMGTIFEKFSPLIDTAYQFIDALLNSSIVVGTVDTIAAGMYLIGMVLEYVVGKITEFSDFILSNWSAIEPIITAIGIAILGMAIAIGIFSAMAIISQGIMTVWTAGVAIWETVVAIATGATSLWGVVQGIFNGTLLACPLVWIIGLVIAVVIALLYWSDGLGIVVGAVFALGAIVANIFSFIWNTILMVAEGLSNAFLWAIESVINLFVWLHNLFLDYVVKPVLWGAATIGDALANAFIGGVNQAIGGINWLIEAINHIPGINIEKLGTWDAKSNLADGVDAFVDSKKMAQVTIPRTNLDHLKTGYFDVGDAYNSGFDMGKGGAEAIKSGISGLLDTSTKNADAVPENLAENAIPGLDSIPGMNGSPAAIENIDEGITNLPETMPGSQNNPSTVEGEVNISEESLQLMRDVANMRYVQNFISVTPNVAVNGVTVNENADYNKLVDKIAKGLDEGLQTEASGVYV